MPKIPRPQLVVGACLVFGVFLLVVTDGAPPDKGKLAEATGKLKHVKKIQSGKYAGSYSVLFELHGFPDFDFLYISKSGNKRSVYQALERAAYEAKQVSVWYEREDLNKAIAREKSHYTVYALASDKTIVRSYDDIASSWREDNRVGKWMGVAFIVYGLVQLVKILLIG